MNTENFSEVFSKMISRKMNEKLYEKVKSVTASGGWTAMDYIVTLEKEVE